MEFSQSKSKIPRDRERSVNRAWKLRAENRALR